MTASKHSKERGRQRLNLKRSSVERMAEIAYEKGVPREATSGALRRYLDSFALTHPGSAFRVYAEAVFVYRDTTLATVWGLPNQFKAAANKLRKGRPS